MTARVIISETSDVSTARRRPRPPRPKTPGQQAPVAVSVLAVDSESCQDVQEQPMSAAAEPPLAESGDETAAALACRDGDHWEWPVAGERCQGPTEGSSGSKVEEEEPGGPEAGKDPTRSAARKVSAADEQQVRVCAQKDRETAGFPHHSQQAQNQPPPPQQQPQQAHYVYQATPTGAPPILSPSQAQFLPITCNGHHQLTAQGLAYPVNNQVFWSHQFAYPSHLMALPAFQHQYFPAPALMGGPQLQHMQQASPNSHTYSLASAVVRPAIYTAHPASPYRFANQSPLNTYDLAVAPNEHQAAAAAAATTTTQLEPIKATDASGHPSGTGRPTDEPADHQDTGSRGGEDNASVADSRDSEGATAVAATSSPAAGGVASDCYGCCSANERQRDGERRLGDNGHDQQVGAFVHRPDKDSKHDCVSAQCGHERDSDCHSAGSHCQARERPPTSASSAPASRQLSRQQQQAPAPTTETDSSRIDPAARCSPSPPTLPPSPTDGPSSRGNIRTSAEPAMVQLDGRSCDELQHNDAYDDEDEAKTTCYIELGGAEDPSGQPSSSVGHTGRAEERRAQCHKGAEGGTSSCTKATERMVGQVDTSTAKTSAGRAQTIDNTEAPSRDSPNQRPASRSGNFRHGERRQAPRVPAKQQHQQTNQISINGTTFYNVPSAALSRLTSQHSVQLHQHHFSPHLLLPYPTYQSLNPAGAHYQHQQQSYAATLPYPCYYSHQPTLTLGSQHQLQQPTTIAHVPVKAPETLPAAFYPALSAATTTSLVHTFAGQHQYAAVAPTYSAPVIAPPTSADHFHHETSTASSTNVGFSQLKLGYNLIPLLPIDSSPTRIRQAYGMDKVWQDEFELLFSKFVSNVVWTLVEVETVPNVRNTSRILNYKGRFIVRVGNGGCGGSSEKSFVANERGGGGGDSSSDSASLNGPSCSSEEYNSGDGAIDQSSLSEVDEEEGEEAECASLRCNDDKVADSDHGQSDCDSGAVFNSATSGTSETTSNEFNPSETGAQALTPVVSPSLQVGRDNNAHKGPVPASLQSGSTTTSTTHGRKFPLRFKMFIDSAKVRFCCDNCGHGWTSMKGRVVFWYELFELIDDGDGISNLIGYCAYKLFGQQCDVCKIENRFERPMWYPEEVTKVLANLYNKIGQVYFGFKMPSIDKQRRAGKPKTSHNSLLCQACHDGVCTDRK